MERVAGRLLVSLLISLRRGNTVNIHRGNITWPDHFGSSSTMQTDGYGWDWEMMLSMLSRCDRLMDDLDGWDWGIAHQLGQGIPGLSEIRMEVGHLTDATWLCYPIRGGKTEDGGSYLTWYSTKRDVHPRFELTQNNELRYWLTCPHDDVDNQVIQTDEYPDWWHNAKPEMRPEFD